MSCICPEHHYKDKDGYPRMKYQSRLYRGNRLMWELCYGPIPTGQVVAHSCNNKGCMNPAHFYLTTPEKNSTDAQVDGLYRRGDNHPRTKRSDEQVMCMLEMYNEGHTQQKIGEVFNISQSRVSESIARARKLSGDNR